MEDTIQRRTHIPPPVVWASDDEDDESLNIHGFQMQVQREMAWKNGNGTTQEIRTEPRDVDFKTQPFIWRLSLATLSANECLFSTFQGFKNTIMLLPNETKCSVKIKHAPTITASTPFVTLKPLIPFSYDASFPTHCTCSTPPIKDITLMVNSIHAYADMSVEQIDKEISFRSLILARWALIYVKEILKRSGEILVRFEEQQEEQDDEDLVNDDLLKAKRVIAGETLVVEKKGLVSPRYLHAKMPLKKRTETNSKKDTVFVFIQIFEQPEHSSARRPSWTNEQISSASYYDDQPLWALPQDMADKINAKSNQIPSSLAHLFQSQENQRSSGPRVSFGIPKSPKLVPLANQSASTNELIDIPTSELFEPANADIGHNYPTIRHLHPSQIYEPPVLDLNQKDTDREPHPFHTFRFLHEFKDPIVCRRLNLDDFERGRISTAWIEMVQDGLGEWIKVPCVVARGALSSNEEEELVLGMTAALHGNEVNGVSVVQRAGLDVSKLTGSVVAIPCLNIPGYLRFSREFSDGKDLNRQFPGKPSGTASQIYAYHIMEKIVNQFSYMIDLHTASFGRINSYYVRADMNCPVAAKLARLQQPQIILHNSGQDGTMRSAATQRGIKSITVEIGNPQQFQNQFIQWTYQGLMNILDHLGMYSHEVVANLKSPRHSNFDGILSGVGTPILEMSNMKINEPSNHKVSVEKTGKQFPPMLSSNNLGISSHEPAIIRQPFPAIICAKGFWTYTKSGGVLEVYPAVNTLVRKDMIVACIKNIFGCILETYTAPCDAMIIGRSSNPVAMSGDRIIHFGVPLRKNEQLPLVAKENY